MNSGKVVDAEPPNPAVAGTRVGFVGAGRIGMPMVRRLVGAGAEVTVYARRPEARERLAAEGARLADEPADVSVGSEAVITCVYSDEQLLAVADEVVPRLESGAVLVSHTTGSPNTLHTLATMARERGAYVVDAAFSGTSEHILAGELTVLLGGSPGCADRCEPLLRTYAGTVIRTGPLGTAMMMKLINNVVFAANVQLSFEVARLADELGVPLDDVLAVLRSSSGGTRALEYLREFGDAARYAEQARPFMVKDVAVCEQVAASMNVDLGFLGSVVHGGSMDVSAS